MTGIAWPDRTFVYWVSTAAEQYRRLPRRPQVIAPPGCPVWIMSIPKGAGPSPQLSSHPHSPRCAPGSGGQPRWICPL